MSYANAIAVLQQQQILMQQSLDQQRAALALLLDAEKNKELTADSGKLEVSNNHGAVHSPASPEATPSTSVGPSEPLEQKKHSPKKLKRMRTEVYKEIRMKLKDAEDELKETQDEVVEDISSDISRGRKLVPSVDSYVDQYKDNETTAVSSSVSAKLVKQATKTAEKIASQLKTGYLTRLQKKVAKILAHKSFDLAMGVIIIANCISVGLEASSGAKNREEPVLQVLETVFLVMYTVELGMRFFAHGFRCLESSWVCFDAFLVFVTWLNVLVIEPNAEALGPASQVASPFIVLRILRLAKLARAVRLVAQARSLWLLVRGMAGSLLTMFYTFIIIFVALYAFACAVLELISRDHQLRGEDPEYEQLVQTYFPDLFTTLITLIQFVTLDSINTIYIPFIMKKPVTCGSLFFLLIMLVSVALMNLVTAVIVEGAIAQANSERDVLKAYKASAVKSMLPRLGSLFHQLDPDGNGKITFDEILEASSELKDELASIVQAEDFVEIFQLLDDDRSGSLDIDEFIQSVTQITSSDLPIESVRMMKQISLCREDLAELRSGLKELIDQRLPIPLIQPSLLPAPPLDSLVADVGLRTRL